ncbi:hypothetical protein [Geminicoccus flavidas]|uniref:hypothetical protein n=1 Tax=Geminicoccus flavidas TaxID=2506407 RepID=UPI0013581AD2|nr:hypothetical protein [Geminicoccus flavidas]
MHVDGRAVDGLTACGPGTEQAIVGQHSMYRMGEVGEEALENGSGGGIAAGLHFQADIAGGAVNRDKGMSLLPSEVQQMSDFQMDEADRGTGEAADRWLGQRWAAVQAVAPPSSDGWRCATGWAGRSGA